MRTPHLPWAFCLDKPERIDAEATLRALASHQLEVPDDRQEVSRVLCPNARVHTTSDFLCFSAPAVPIYAWEYGFDNATRVQPVRPYRGGRLRLVSFAFAFAGRRV
jgi:hypothetical protein